MSSLSGCQIMDRFPNFNSCQPSFYILPRCLALLCNHMPSAGLTQWKLAANVICICLARERSVAMVIIMLHLLFHCFHGSLPEQVPMMYSASPASVSAATSPATSVPYTATAPANQVCSFLKLSVVNPWALNKCFIFKWEELLCLPACIAFHQASHTRRSIEPQGCICTFSLMIDKTYCLRKPLICKGLCCIVLYRCMHLAFSMSFSLLKIWSIYKCCVKWGGCH